MTTTINTRSGTVPFEVALERAKRAYLSEKKKDVRSMTTAELEKRRAVIREYLALSRIDRMTDNRRMQFAAFVQRATR